MHTISRAALPGMAALLLAAMGAGAQHSHGGRDAHRQDSARVHEPGEMREAAGPAPAVALEVEADAAGGFNLHLVTENFRFSPEKVGMPADAVEGHAHLYVNGVKMARVYGPWFHMPGDWVAGAESRLRVTLNDNVHSVWTKGGDPVAAEVVLGGTAPFEGVLFERWLGDGAIETLMVERDASVRLVLHVAPGAELHLHGYDIEAEAPAGAPVVMTFEARHPGRFAISAHGRDDVLGRSDKALAYLEVRP